MVRRRGLCIVLFALFGASGLFQGAALAQSAATPAPPAEAQPSPPDATPVPAGSTNEPSPRPPLVLPSSSSAGASTTTAGTTSPAAASEPEATTPRSNSGAVAPNPRDVFSDDWWGLARPVLDLHGYFRTRAELFQNFSLNRHSSSFQSNDPQYLWPIPLDQSYMQLGGKGGTQGATVALCGPQTPLPNQNCTDKTESGANVRFRLDPEIDISDNLRIVSEVFALDNLVLGSTPNAYANQPAGTTPPKTASGVSVNTPTGYQSAGYNAYAPLGFFSTTQGPPTAGVNSYTNSIEVQRVWAEYMTPVGQLRFGRMPSQWGLGMVDNGGDGIDSDYQTTTDRIMFITGIKSMDLYFGGAWDFISNGPSATPGSNSTNAYTIYGGQPYNTCNDCNVNEWAAFVAHRTNPEMQKLTLAQGGLVINGGVYAKYRSQNLDVAAGTTPETIDYSTAAQDNGLEVRQAWSVTPDLWLQALWNKLRFEAEAAMIWGEIGNIPGLNSDVGNPVDIRQFGVATQTEYRAIEDKLDLQFGFGWASGDPWAYNSPQNNANFTAGALNPAPGLPHEYNTYGPMSTFAFHPDYRVDLIFFRNILSRIEGAYYFRPSVDYDFVRHADGEKLGGGLAAIWSRASQFVQSPGHQSDLGIELDAQLYYQSKDGSLNDDPQKIGGFYAMLQYGVFFPLGGLSYLPGDNTTGADASLSAAQIVRLFLGAVF
jgi:uncharacterized protein (TIGR04551 family)